jgi:hypothetical protein
MRSQTKQARINQTVGQNYGSGNVNDYIRRKRHATKYVTRETELRA